MTAIRHSARAISSPSSDEVTAIFGPEEKPQYSSSTSRKTKGASIDFLLAAQVMSVHDIAMQIADEMDLAITSLQVDTTADYHAEEDCLHIYLNLKPEVRAHHRRLILWLQAIEERCLVTQMLTLAGDKNPESPRDLRSNVVSNITHFTLN